MTKIEDKISDMLKNEDVRDVGIISGISIVEYVAHNMITRETPKNYEKPLKGALIAVSTALSYYLGKSKGESLNEKNDQNGNP